MVGGKSGRVLAGGVGVAAVLLLIGATWFKHEERHVKFFPATDVMTSAKRDAELKGDSASWVPFEAREHPDPPTALWGKVKRPFPTGAWWTNLVVGGPSSSGDGLGAALVTPYAVTITPLTGVGVSCGAMNVANESLTISVSASVGMRALEGVEDRKVMGYDDLTMVMRLVSPAPVRLSLRQGKAAEPAAEVDVLLARGSPYVTFFFRGATPYLVSDFEIKSFSAANTRPRDDDAADAADAPKECSAYPTCVAAALHGNCCPLPAGAGLHPCCATPVAAQGPAELFSLELANGEKWRLYTSSPLAVTWSSKGVTATKPFTGVIRLAMVPTPVPEEAAADGAKVKGASTVTPDEVMLDAHAEAYPTAGEVRVSADRSRSPTTASIEFLWRVAYMGSSLSLDSATSTPALLMLALPHHIETLVVDSSVGFLAPSSLAYRGGLKGRMTAVLGASWKMTEPLSPINFAPPRPIASKEKREVIRAQLSADVARPSEPDEAASGIAFDPALGNAYWNGKECARLAALALIAKELGEEEVMASAMAQMTSILELWLTAKNADPLVYDATYGGLCTKNGLYDHDADFGNGYYNDHHFHYGYLLYASAVAVKLDPSFEARHHKALFALLSVQPTALLYDVASPGTGVSFYEAGLDRAAFPKARHKDFYEGHSWASGLFFMGQGKAQESSSEAVNAYYSAYLLSLALGDVELADWNRALLALEVRAANTYYHMKKDTEIYPAQFAQNKMVGVLGALSTGSVTWFGTSTAFSHGIQIIPVTPITEMYLQPDFVREDVAYLEKHLDRESCDDAWLAFLECERAVVDPETAWTNLLALQDVDPGASKTAMLHFIATRPPPSHGTP